MRPREFTRQNISIFQSWRRLENQFEAIAAIIFVRVARHAGNTAATTPITKAPTKIMSVLAIGNVNALKPESLSDTTITMPVKMPSTTPVIAPNSDVMTLSQRTIVRTCERVIPTLRNRPISRRRSKTDNNSVMMMPTIAMITDKNNKP